VNLRAPQGSEARGNTRCCGASALAVAAAPQDLHGLKSRNCELVLRFPVISRVFPLSEFAPSLPINPQQLIIPATPGHPVRKIYE
jgi:hypothetical protein